jgi:UDP-N-acetylglucosamine 2-epimerase (non-hydrolysing)
MIDNSDPIPDLNYKDYFLLTLHRQENVDSKEKLQEIFEGLKLIHDRLGFVIIWPMHPRTKKRLVEYNLAPTKVLTVIEPVSYLAFLRLERDAKLILTDSGGVQEEACILGIPCVTLRCNTERPETIDVGANILAGTKPSEMLEKVKIMLNANNSWENPFGEGTAAKQIISILSKNSMFLR